MYYGFLVRPIKQKPNQRVEHAPAPFLAPAPTADYHDLIVFCITAIHCSGRLFPAEECIRMEKPQTPRFTCVTVRNSPSPHPVSHAGYRAPRYYYSLGSISGYRFNRRQFPEVLEVAFRNMPS